MKDRMKLWLLPLFSLFLTGCGNGNKAKVWPAILILNSAMGFLRFCFY